MGIWKGSACSAINCSNNKSKTPDLSFFTYPKDEERCKKWIINTRRMNSTVHSVRWSRLCSLHFEDSQFMNSSKKSLIHSAVPTIFDFSSPPKSVTLKKSLPIRNQPRSLPKLSQPRSLPKQSQPRSLPKQSQPRKLPRQSQPRSSPKQSQPRSLPKQSQRRNLPKQSQSRSLPKRSQPATKRRKCKNGTELKLTGANDGPSVDSCDTSVDKSSEDKDKDEMDSSDLTVSKSSDDKDNDEIGSGDLSVHKSSDDKDNDEIGSGDLSVHKSSDDKDKDEIIMELKRKVSDLEMKLKLKSRELTVLRSKFHRFRIRTNEFKKNSCKQHGKKSC